MLEHALGVRAAELEVAVVGAAHLQRGYQRRSAAAASVEAPGSEPSRYSERPDSWHSAATPQIQSAPVIRWGTGSPISRAASRTP